jgi:uncharacterized protein (TIGR00255 family)
MTGYARSHGISNGVGFSCEIKSVNGRGLDIRIRLAPGLDSLEGELRRRIGKSISRGSLALTIGLDRQGTGGDVVVNEQALDAVVKALNHLSARVDASKPSLDGILALKGVLEQRENPMSAEAEEMLNAAILDCAESALADLVTSRQAEGMRLAAILNQRLDEIEVLTLRAEVHPARNRDAILEKLRRQVADLLDAGIGIVEDRLAQEALLLATKADIREELDRLTAHIASARQLIAMGGPSGRKLDFLAQEFNREANTLCAKSNAVDLTAIGLDLKAAIDQLREQVQNIE